MPCPLCHTEQANLSLVEAFTLGSGLGSQFGTLEDVRGTMCSKHRIANVLAMASVAAKISALTDAPIAQDALPSNQN